ncbi:MAG: hypothetical protein ABIP88_13880 [Candidatus Binatia bacterium]
MTAFTHAYKTSTRNFKTIAMAERLRRWWITDPMLLAITIGIVGLIAMFCLFAMAAMATLFGAEAFGDFLRDAGQQVGGAGGIGAAGAGAAGGTTAARHGLPPNYTTPERGGRYYNEDAKAYPPGSRPGAPPPTVERNGKLYVKDYWNGRFQGYREVQPTEWGFEDPGQDIPHDLLGMRG